MRHEQRDRLAAPPQASPSRCCPSADEVAESVHTRCLRSVQSPCAILGLITGPSRAAPRSRAEIGPHSRLHRPQEAPTPCQDSLAPRSAALQPARSGIAVKTRGQRRCIPPRRQARCRRRLCSSSSGSWHSSSSPLRRWLSCGSCFHDARRRRRRHAVSSRDPRADAPAWNPHEHAGGACAASHAVQPPRSPALLHPEAGTRAHNSPAASRALTLAAGATAMATAPLHTASHTLLRRPRSSRASTRTAAAAWSSTSSCKSSPRRSGRPTARPSCCARSGASRTRARRRAASRQRRWRRRWCGRVQRQRASC